MKNNFVKIQGGWINLNNINYIINRNPEQYEVNFLHSDHPHLLILNEKEYAEINDILIRKYNEE